LGQAKCANGRTRTDGKTTFLPNQGLKKGAPLDRRKSRAPHTRKAACLLCDPDDQLFNIGSSIAKHLRATGIGINVARAINGFYRSRWITIPIF